MIQCSFTALQGQLASVQIANTCRHITEPLKKAKKAAHGQIEQHNSHVHVYQHSF